MEGFLSRLQVTLLYERDVSADAPPPVARGVQTFSEERLRERIDRYRSACVVQTLSEDALEALGQVCPMDAQAMRPRLRRGDRCYVAWVDGRAVHFTWVQVSGWHYLLSAGLWHRIRKGEAWLYHGHTAAGFRGRGVCYFVGARILENLRRDGAFQRVIVYTTQDNRASQGTIRRTGFSLKRRHYALRVRGVHIPLPGLSTVLHGGDAMEYVLSFPEAAKELLRRFGVIQAPSRRPADLWY